MIIIKLCFPVPSDKIDLHFYTCLHTSYFLIVSLSEVFGLPRMQHASHPDEPARNAGRFDEPKRPLNYPHAAEDFMDSRSSASPLGMEQRHGMERARRYSNNLDKITSTLLELVARK